MYNPSYLIKSRHDIYYFRYPLPVTQRGRAGRVSISLKTRCPREALKLANALEYHSNAILEELDYQSMDYKELVAVFKDHFAKLLKVKQMTMDEFGPLSKSEVTQMKRSIQLMDSMIENDVDCIETLRGSQKPREELDIHKSIMNISKLYELDIEPDSDEYELARKQYKYVFKNLYKDILTYNEQLTSYSMLDAQSDTTKPNNDYKPAYKLEKVMEGYLKELEANIEPRSFKDQADCLNYLIDYLGADYLVTKLDVEGVQDIKGALQVTPTRRNVIKLTRGLPLSEQIAVAERNGLEMLSATSVNKYLGYFSCLFDWAKRNRLVEDNLFDGIRVKNNKKDNRRDMFNKDEVALILEELEANKSGKVKNKSQYWGALIAIYTGARRNEIGALMVDDVKQDKETGIWYFDITDEEEEGKDVKTEAARRLVPLHSRLIDLGFMDYWEEAKKIVESTPKKDGMSARLLYNFTYTDHDKWGRMLGQFMNDRLLDYLGLRVKNKKTLHSLRHSFITYLDVANVKATTIKSMVGHEQGTVTHGIYTHYGIDHLPQFKKAIEKLPY